MNKFVSVINLMSILNFVGIIIIVFTSYAPFLQKIYLPCCILVNICVHTKSDGNLTLPPHTTEKQVKRAQCNGRSEGEKGVLQFVCSLLQFVL